MAEAKQKGLKAFFKWSNVLSSPRIHVNVKMRVIHSVIRPVMEYGMEVWGPPSGDPQALLTPLDEVVQMACRVATGVRSYAEEPAWTRQQCVSSPVMLSTLCCMPMDAACDVARFRYAERLRVSHARRSGAIPDDCDDVARRNLESLLSSLPSLHFRDHAYTRMDVQHPWWERAKRAPTPAQNEQLSALRAIPNSRMSKQVFKAVTTARQAAVRAKPSAPETSAAGRTLQRPTQEPHYNPVHDSLCMPERLPTLLHAPDAVVYPLLTVRSARLPCTATVRWDDCFRDGVCPRAECAFDVDGSVGACTAVERRWRCVQHVLFSCSHAPGSCPRPAHLWDDLMTLLPEESPARAKLHAAHSCDKHDMAAVRDHCVPWVLDPALVLKKEPAKVRLNAASVVAAYLMAVGASLSNIQAPSTHARFLRLPNTVRMRLFCGVEPDDSYLGDSDDEVWLRDDVPSAQWLAGHADPEAAHIAAGASARNTPLSSAFVGITPAEAHEAEASPHG